MVLLKYFNAGTLSTLSNVLACSRRSDRGDGADSDFYSMVHV